MADYSTYHSSGYAGAPGQDPNRQHGYPYPNASPSSAASQPGAPYGGAPLQHPQFAAQAGAGYAPGTGPVAPAPDANALGGLATQMEGLGITSADASARAHKKKHRHAYHDFGGPSPQAPNQFPSQTEAQPHFLNTGLNQPDLQSAATGFAGAPAGQVPSNVAQGAAPTDAGYQPTGIGSIPTQGKIDPEQIPSVPRSRDLAAQYYFSHVYPTMERHVPPPASIPFIAHDQGNSSPKFARLTLNNIPASSDFLHSTGLPLAMILQPLARIDAGEQPVPVIDFGDVGPPRCRRCRTYINPFMTFKYGGNKFVCNMCTFPNDVPPEYFAPIDQHGARVDRMQRPELMMGTVEFTVPKEYWVKEPVGLRQLFLIDVTQESVNKGFLKGVCDGIINALYGGEEEEKAEGEESEPRKIPEGSKIGIVTFDREIHFYNLCDRLDKAQMMVMTDLEEPFVPLSEGLFVDPYESKDIITSLLEQLPTIFSHVKTPESALLPTINAAMSALQATGGKIICSLASLPTYGPGKLVMRDKSQAPDGETKLFAIDNQDWKNVATKLTEAGIGIDFFVASPGGSFIDLTTIGYPASISGGESFFYPNFHAPRDLLKLSEELSHSVTRETGYQALMKVRCSNGLQVSAYHGNFLQHTFGADLEIGIIDADKALGVIFSYDGKLDPKLDAHFQAALLYTSASGQRRVRCVNIVAGVNEGGIETMKCIDQDAVVGIIAKEAASKAGDKTLKDIRANITEKTVDIFAGYRKNFSGSHPPGQLVMPENLKEFSMYMLSLIKSRAFKGGSETADRRVHDLRMLRGMGCMEMSLYLYPRIIPIHNMSAEDGFANEQGQLQVPPTMRASFSRVEEGGVYLVDNGQSIILWLHSFVSPNLLEDLFGPGITSLQALDPNTSSLPVLETHLNAQVRNLLQYLSTVRGSKAVTIQLARQGLDGAEYEFARLLLEDRNNEAQSYVDWLVHVHRQINLELAGHRKKDEAGTSGEGALSSLAAIRAPYW